MGETDDHGIKSDEKLFAIIEHLEDGSARGVTELATELGTSKGNVHAHLASLEDRGYVVNDGGRYRLGLEFLRYGIKARASYEEYELIEKKVTQLAEETGERAWAHVEENGKAYYLCGAIGEHPVQPPVRVGEPIHMHQIAGGKAILACYSRERIQGIIDRHGLPAKTDETITDSDELFAELAEIRDRGYAYNKQESVEGLHAIAASIRGPEDGVFGSLSIPGPANRLNEEALTSTLPDLLLGAVNELEINLRHGR